MRARDFIKKLRNNLQGWQARRDKELLTIALDLSAQVKFRIQSSGRDSNNQSFAPYTPIYSRVRARAGYQVQYVDFTRTGRLMANIKPEILSSDINGATVRITARDSGNQSKLVGALKKRGNILVPTQDEINDAFEAYAERAVNYLFG